MMVITMIMMVTNMMMVMIIMIITWFEVRWTGVRQPVEERPGDGCNDYHDYLDYLDNDYHD